MSAAAFGERHYLIDAAPAHAQARSAIAWRVPTSAARMAAPLPTIRRNRSKWLRMPATSIVVQKWRVVVQQSHVPRSLVTTISNSVEGRHEFRPQVAVERNMQ